MAGKYNDSKVNEDEAFFLSRNDLINRWGNIISSWSFLPGLVGFWPMSPVQRSTGNAYDMSGQGRTLTYNGNPTYNIYNNFVPYIDLDGAGDFLLRADETDLDVLGTETINAAAVRGATFGGWFWADVLATSVLIGKWTTAGNQRSYMEYITGAGGTITGAVSTNGIAVLTQASSNAIVVGSWFFAVTRFVPSTTLDIYLNNTKTTLAAGVPASIFNSTAGLIVGANEAGASALLDGRATLCFLSHQIFSDALINAMFQQSRILFGV